MNFGNANPNSTTINPDILGGWGVRPYDWQFGVSMQHELVPRVSVEAAYNRRWWGNFFVTDNVLTTAADYDVYSLVIPQHENLPGGGENASFVAITQAANSRGSQNYMTSETGLRRRAHVVLARRGLHRDRAVGEWLHDPGRHQHGTRGTR